MLEVVQAAIRDPEGKVHTLPRPARHSGVYFQMMREGTPYASDEVVKGFLLSDGTFASRRQAGRVAVKAGQVEKYDSSGLITDDLW